MTKAVGLDIGSRACKVAVLSGNTKGAKLLRFAEVEYEYGEAGALTPSVVLEALKKALVKARAPRHCVGTAIPAEQLTLREITVPFTEDDQIAKTVKFEFEPHLHSGSIEDYIVDYVKTGTTKNGTRVLVFAASKEMLRSRLEQLSEVGVDPLHLDVDVAALFNTAKRTAALEQHPNCLVIDIGARTTKTLLVQDGRLRVARSIRLGAQGAMARLTSEFEGDAAAAERAMAEAGTPEALAQMPAGRASTIDIVVAAGAVETAAAEAQESDFLTRVLRETQRSLPTIGEEQALTRVFLTGGGAARPHARERIAQHYNVEVEDLPTLDAVQHDLPPSEADRIAASGAVAIGAALKVLGIDAGEIDLRREDFRFARTFDQIKVALATGVTLVFFALFLVLFTKFMELETARKNRRQLEALMKKELKVDVLDNYEKTVKDAGLPSEAERRKDEDEDLYIQRMKTRLAAIRSHLKNELGLTTELQPIRSCLETWSVVMQCAREVRQEGQPKSIQYFAIQEEKYSQDKAELKVVVGDYPDIDTFVAALSRHKEIFESVNQEPPKAVKDKGYGVTIKIQLKPKENPGTTAETSAADSPSDEATAREHGK